MYSVYSLRRLKVQHRIWKLASETAGLVLKPSKCFLVVTSTALSPQVEDAIARWLQHEIPDWKDMQVVNRGKYVGVFLGVGGCEKTLEACEEKCLSRCFESQSKCCLRSAYDR